MIYYLSLHINEFHMAAALATAIGFVVITIAKEKSDERKRA
jgi:hypothetical protein